VGHPVNQKRGPNRAGHNSACGPSPLWRISAALAAIAFPHVLPLFGIQTLLARCIAWCIRCFYHFQAESSGVEITVPGFGDPFTITPECTYLGVCLAVAVLYPYSRAWSLWRNVANVLLAIALLSAFNVLRIAYAIGEYAEGRSWFWSHTVIAHGAAAVLLVLYGVRSLRAEAPSPASSRDLR